MVDAQSPQVADAGAGTGQVMADGGAGMGQVMANGGAGTGQVMAACKPLANTPKASSTSSGNLRFSPNKQVLGLWGRYLTFFLPHVITLRN